MRFLVVGAGGIGGYFGGRLLEVGQDVTFLLRPRRAEQIRRNGLTIRSQRGDAHLPSPPHLLAEQIDTPFDVIVLSCKAYDLESAMDAFAPAVGPDTIILPLLNGMSHLDRLDARFGGERVLGGYCICSTTLDADGSIVHFGDAHRLVLGPREPSQAERVAAIAAAFASANFDGQASDTIIRDMWGKWIFIASTAGITCLMRAAVGDIVAAGGADIADALFDECASIAADAGYPIDDTRGQRRATLVEPGSTMMASMLRDIERGGRTEGDHLLGDLLGRAGSQGDFPLLRTAYTHLKAYEARRARESAS